MSPDKKYTVDSTTPYSPGSVVHAAMIAAMREPVTSVNNNRQSKCVRPINFSYKEHLNRAFGHLTHVKRSKCPHPPLGKGGGGRGRFRARLPPLPPLLSGGGGPRRGLMSS